MNGKEIDFPPIIVMNIVMCPHFVEKGGPDSPARKTERAQCKGGDHAQTEEKWTRHIPSEGLRRH